jgi:AcrR family transcriptional regulator
MAPPASAARSDDPPRRHAPAEAAIMAATEELLQQRSFSELNVADIIEVAGVSRTTFYAYFPSRTAVIAECLRRVTGEIAVAVDPFLTDALTDPEAAIRSSLRRWVALATAHGALLRTVSEQWPHDAQLRELWLAVMETFSAGTAGVIEAARARGQAPAGADPLALATCLMWGYERVLHVSLTGEADGLPDPDTIIEPLAQMMTAGVFGR